MELSEYSADKKKEYQDAAIELLHVLASTTYKAPIGNNGNFLLMHSVGSIPHKVEIDGPLVYADYYFLEGLTRYHRTIKGESALAN